MNTFRLFLIVGMLFSWTAVSQAGVAGMVILGLAGSSPHHPMLYRFTRTAIAQ